MNNKIKLFQTAKTIYERGDIKLSASDRKRIEDETKDLIKRSTSYRSASKSDSGFGKVLSDLKCSKDADESFKIVARYLKSEGMIDEAIKDMEEAVESIKDSIEQVEEAVEGKDKDSDKSKEKKEPKEKSEDKEDKSKGKFEGKPEDEFESEENESEDKLKGDKPDFMKNLDKAKEAILRAAQSLEMNNSSPSLISKDDEMDGDDGLGKGKGLGLGKGKGKGPLGKPIKLDDIKKKDKAEEKVTEDEMGIEKGKGPLDGLSAKVKVFITPEKNIMASHSDHGPMFLAVPNDNVKKNAEQLRRTANKVLGLIIYDGPKVAAAKCNATLIAGVDEDVLTDSDKKVEPADSGITEKGEIDSKEERSSEPKTVLEKNEVDTQDKPDKVTAIKRRLKERKMARFEVVKKAGDTILDDAQNLAVGDSEVNPNSLSVLKDNEVDTQDNRPNKPSDTLSGGESDIKKIEANFKKLYDNRARKMAAEGIKNFVDKFTRCVRIASKRMALNHDDNPIKAAAIDILTSNNIDFSNGEGFNPMDIRAAKELVELISSESHDVFVDHLVGKAADLMEKSDDYLEDIENDLEDLIPVDVKVKDEFEPRRNHNSNKRSADLRRAANEGNLEVNIGGFSRTHSSVNPTNMLRDAIGSTKIGIRTAKLKSLSMGR